MWSGPRNVSTALMRSFEARGDTFVVDEPLYAHYLAATGLAHPLATEVIAAGETDWRAVARALTAPPPDGSAVFYQKHMAHHLLPEIGREWLGALRHAFLIREPGAMLASLDAKYPAPGLLDTGLPQQVELFDAVRAATGATPPVVDSRDLLEAPGAVLAALCARLDLDYTPRMLSWPPGPRASDGVWAGHWYHNVLDTTGFGRWSPPAAPLPAHLEPLLAECHPYYERLYAHRLTA
ncbi:MAG: HAD family hydrolase [Planctomycetes bacterium]|nr:HAD family hydrolase [Planctomycetota bacterium]